MKVLLVPNTGNPAAVAAATELSAWLHAEGFEPLMAAEDAAAIGLERLGVPSTEIGVPLMAVALGGDGTILKTVHLLGEVEVPLLGVNLGRLGFMSGASGDDLRGAVAAALAGEGRIERRATLEARVVMEGREVGRYRALNEVHVGRGGSGRLIEIALSVDGLDVHEFACDGVVVATPTGSTAYALSAGGPIVSPDVACQVVVPVAAHVLTVRSMVLPASAEVCVRLPNPARRDACLQVDGDPTPCRRAIESVTVRACPADVLLVKLDGREFLEVVADEFFGR